MIRHKKLKTRGIVLMATFFALILLAGMAVFYFRFSRQAADSAKRVRLNGDRQDLARYIRSLTNCPETLTRLPNPCEAGTFVALYQGDSVRLIQTPDSDSSTIVGLWSIRAQCTETAKTFLVEVAAVNGDNCRGDQPPCWETLLTPPLTCP